MKRKLLYAFLPFVCGLLLRPYLGMPAAHAQPENNISLGNFSVSLAVKDLQKSMEFYEKLGFKPRGGDKKTWVVLQDDTAVIGLFHGMVKKNTLTFNPGWDKNKNTLAHFQDVRELQKLFLSKGITLDLKADEASTGPAYITLTDPDGNPILIDQFVPAPKK